MADCIGGGSLLQVDLLRGREFVDERGMYFISDSETAFLQGLMLLEWLYRHLYNRAGFNCSQIQGLRSV